MLRQPGENRVKQFPETRPILARSLDDGGITLYLSIIQTRPHCFSLSAQSRLGELDRYGITGNELADLEQKLAAFKALDGKPRAGVTASRAATQRLEKHFAEADSVLDTRLDRLIVQFRRLAPDFYNEYQSARVIVDRGGSRPGETPAEPVPAGSAPKA